MHDDCQKKYESRYQYTNNTNNTNDTNKYEYGRQQIKKRASIGLMFVFVCEFLFILAAKFF
jgi:hypothetical protein